MTLTQQMSALAHANEVRLARSKVKLAIKEGSLSVREALTLGCCQSMTVYQLLVVQRAWGVTRVLGVLGPLGIGARKRICDLTERQRGLVVEACERGKT